MKIKSLALLVAAVSLAAGAVLTSCQKVEPTALNTENMQYVTKVSGVVRCYITNKSGSSSWESAEKATVIAEIYIKSVNEKGETVEEFMTSVSATTKNEGEYVMNLPLAPGESYKVILSSSVQTDTYKNSKADTACFYDSKTLDNVSAGQEKVGHLNCKVVGYPLSPDDPSL